MQPHHDPDVVLDTSGEECPVPVERAAERIEALDVGQVLRVIATDPVAPIDLEAWCMRQVHDYLGSEERGGAWEIRIRKRLPRQ